MNMEQTIKVMLVEDHPSYRRVIERTLSATDTIELTGIFGAAEIALRNVKNLSIEDTPDVILLDLHLAGVSGLEAIELFFQAIPSIKIIVLTQSDAASDVQSAIQKGARGYLLKSSTASQIVHAIETVAHGGASIDEDVAPHLLKMVQEKSKQIEPKISLSVRETEILLLLRHGFVKKQIAEELKLSYGSVATYIRRLYDKLGVQNGAAAIDMAYRLGILKRDQE